MSRYALVAIAMLVLIVSVATGTMSRSQSFATPGTPAAFPTCAGSVPPASGCLIFVRGGTPLLLLGPPENEPTITPTMPATCVPFEVNTGCVRTAPSVLREHWTATAAAGG